MDWWCLITTQMINTQKVCGLQKSATISCRFRMLWAKDGKQSGRCLMSHSMFTSDWQSLFTRLRSMLIDCQWTVFIRHTIRHTIRLYGAQCHSMFSTYREHCSGKTLLKWIALSQRIKSLTSLDSQPNSVNILDLIQTAVWIPMGIYGYPVYRHSLQAIT